MRLDLTGEELKGLMAHHHAMNGLRAQFEPLLAVFNRHAEEQEKIVARIRERVADLPKAPLSKWDFSRVDPVLFAGPVEVPEE